MDEQIGNGSGKESSLIATQSFNRRKITQKSQNVIALPCGIFYVEQLGLFLGKGKDLGKGTKEPFIVLSLLSLPNRERRLSQQSLHQ